MLSLSNSDKDLKLNSYVYLFLKWKPCLKNGRAQACFKNYRVLAVDSDQRIDWKLRAVWSMLESERVHVSISESGPTVELICSSF